MLAPVLAALAAVALLLAIRALVARFAALRASERLHRTLVQAAPDVTMLLIDRGLRFRLLEGAALERHGWAREDLIGKRIADVLPPDRAPALIAAVEAALRGESGQLDWPGIRGDARYSLLLGPFEEQRRGITHAICIVRDVTAKWEAARELDEQRDFLASLLGQLSDRVFACDAEGRILTFDDAAVELDPPLGADMHPLEWAGAFGLMHPDGTPMGPHEAPLLRALRGERIDGVEMLIDGADGRVALVCSGGPVTAPDGHRLGAVVTATDLTGRRETEELLRVSEERHRRVVESMTDCVFETDEKGRWTFLNQAWTVATGYAVADSLGRRATDFVHPADRARHFRMFEPLQRGEHGSVRFSHRFLTSEGAVRWVDVRVSTIPGWDGLPTGFLGVMRDITDEQRTRQHAAAEQAVVRLLAGAQSLEEAAPELLEALCRDLEWDTAELWRRRDGRVHGRRRRDRARGRRRAPRPGVDVARAAVARRPAVRPGLRAPAGGGRRRAAFGRRAAAAG
jgi:PAS domain S-box-containing protein